MNQVQVYFIVFTLLVQGCDDDHQDKDLFAYNPATGRCENYKGISGYNILNIDKIRRTKNCECYDLSGQNLVYLLDTTKIQNFNKLGYNTLIEYSFKGSKFDDASLFFNNITKADLSGANLKKLGMGYAVMVGKIDSYTQFPIDGQCKIEGDTLKCAN